MPSTTVATLDFEARLRPSMKAAIVLMYLLTRLGIRFPDRLMTWLAKRATEVRIVGHKKWRSL